MNMDAEISAVIINLQAKRQELLGQAEKLAEAIATLEKIFSEKQSLNVVEDRSSTPENAPRNSPPRQNSNIPGPFAGMTIHDAAIRVLRAQGSPRKTRFIADELENGGAKSSQMYRAVYNSLSQSDAAVLVDGLWSLVSWGQK